MDFTILDNTRDRIPDVLDFERRPRQEEDFWSWEIDGAYISAVERIFDDPAFRECLRSMGVQTLVALTASNGEAQRF